MIVKRRPHRFLSLLAVALTLGSAGCVQTSAPRRPVVEVTRPATYALSISVTGGLPPSPGQWAAIQATFARLLAREGITLVSDLSLADRILRIEFVPDLLDPENRGKAEIVSIRSNPLYGTPATSTPLLSSYGGFPYAFGWNSFYWASRYGFGYDSYYGFGHAYYDGYTYATPTLNPRRPRVVDGTHRHRHPESRHSEPRTPGDHDRPRRPEPPDRRGPPVLAAMPPAEARPTPAVYPATEPGKLAFPDDLRLARPARLASSGSNEARSEGYRGRYEQAAGSNETHRSWLGRSLAAADGQGSSGSTSSQRTESGYRRRDGSDASTDRGSYRRESTATYQRSESSGRVSEGSSSSSSYSSSSSSSSSYSAPSYSPPSDSGSSANSSSSGSSASSAVSNRAEK